MAAVTGRAGPMKETRMRTLQLRHVCENNKRFSVLWVTIIEIPQAAPKA
jgi:hypothetical protein